jgi:probable HAF family extracellular repeat protein
MSNRSTLSLRLRARRIPGYKRPSYPDRQFLTSIAGVLCLAGAAAARPVEYTITDLGSLPASTICNCFFATSISQNGNVTGLYFGPANEQRGFIWRNGVISDIGGAPGATHVALGVNDDGVVAGFGSAFAFRAENGTTTDLPGLGGPFSDARDINNAGVIVGEANTGPGGLQHAAMWIGNTVTDLGTLGGELSQAMGINNSGQIVGWAWNAQRQQRAFIWSQATGMVELAAPQPDAQAVVANGLNEHGQAVGSALIPSSNDPTQFSIRAFVWNNGVPTDLGDLGDPGTRSVGAASINDAGVIVGNLTFDIDHLRPFVVRGGTMADPNTLIDPAQGWVIDDVDDINNAGVIAASGRNIDGRRHAVILTPVPVCIADFDANGAVNSQDFFAFLAAFFNADPRADIDNSGQVDSADFFAFLTAFFQGCSS